MSRRALAVAWRLRSWSFDGKKLEQPRSMKADGDDPGDDPQVEVGIAASPPRAPAVFKDG